MGMLITIITVSIIFNYIDIENSLTILIMSTGLVGGSIGLITCINLKKRTKMKNVLWYLGFLSLLSLLYFVNGNTDYLGFLGFVTYFAIHNKNDERLEKNVGKSTRNAFLFLVFAGAASFAYYTLTGDVIFLAKTSKLLFVECIIICVFSYYYYNFMEEHLWRQKSKNTEKSLK